MKIVWLSASKFGYELFLIAHKIYGIDSIITLSDESETIMYDKVPRNKWYNFEVPVYEISDINKSDKILEKLNPDIIFVAGWRQKIKKELIDKYTFIGFHPTLLPKGRGPAPIINTLLTDFKNTGVTMFYLNDELDAGDIIAQEIFGVGRNDTAEMVYNNFIICGRLLISTYLPMLIYGIAPRIPQDETKATYFTKPKLSDNEIDLDCSIDEIYSKIRALSKPYRGAYIEKDGKKLIIWKAELI